MQFLKKLKPIHIEISKILNKPTHEFHGTPIYYEVKENKTVEILINFSFTFISPWH